MVAHTDCSKAPTNMKNLAMLTEKTFNSLIVNQLLVCEKNLSELYSIVMLIFSVT